MVLVGSSPDATLNSARPRDSQTEPISGTDGCGMPCLPYSMKPLVIGSVILSADSVHAGGRGSAAYMASMNSVVIT